MKLPTLLADWREPPERVDELRTLGLNVWYDELAREPELDYGDYAWTSLWHGNCIGVEMKTAAEALSRYQAKGRGHDQRSLQDQLRGLHQDFQLPIFLFGGRITITPDGYCRTYGFDRLIHYNGWHNWLHLSLPRDLPGLMVDHIDDERYLMRRLFSIVNYFEKRDHKATWALQSSEPLFVVDEGEAHAVKALMSYPHVGEELARRLLSSGLTPGEALKDIMDNAGETVRTAEGWGPERVKGIKAVLDWRKEASR